MVYKPLQFKYRPKYFFEVVGHENICNSIKNSIILNKIHFAYLFSGPKGVGKTTLARLFSKLLNCINNQFGDSCMKCECCQKFLNNNFIDFHEIDAASFSNLDNIKVLLSDLFYKPIFGKYKIYLIDEVHMLSKYSFNYLLKILEEPPIYVKFILVTSDYQKILDTVLSRCIHYKLNKINEFDINKKLIYVLDQEKIKYNKNYIQILSHKCDGSIRDALNIVEQLISLEGNINSIKIINNMFGIIDISKQINLLILIEQKNYKKINIFLSICYRLNINYYNLIYELFELIHTIYIYKKLNFKKNYYKKLYLFLNKKKNILTINFLIKIYKIFLFHIKNLKYFINHCDCLEMIILNCL